MSENDNLRGNVTIVRESNAAATETREDATTGKAATTANAAQARTCDAQETEVRWNEPSNDGASWREATQPPSH